MFFKMYFLRLGFLDGAQGFILCKASAGYVFAKYAKLWLKKRKKEKGKRRN
jgi:(heptosyl)LPS beta-1,4-glucosyltransferase